MQPFLFLLSITSFLLLADVVLGQTIRINVGSDKSYTDKDGRVWVADRLRYRGQDEGETVTWETNEPIQSTENDALYQTERFTRDQVLKYSIPVSQPGDYRVRLHWSENYIRDEREQGERIFHVAIEGKIAMKNVNIYKTAKDTFKATSKAVRTIVSGKTLDIEFIKVKQNPKVNAIEITKIADTSPIPIHSDITAILDVPGGDDLPLGIKWADSYSIGERCFCLTTFDHNIDVVQAQTPAGWMTVREACELIGPGPGYKEGYPIYNTVQCGHGPLNDAGDEHNCPGRVDYEFLGCGHIGPKWKFDEED